MVKRKQGNRKSIESNASNVSEVKKSRRLEEEDDIVDSVEPFLMQPFISNPSAIFGKQNTEFSAKQKVAVIGSRGRQGRAVCKALLELNRFEVIGLTRDVNVAQLFPDGGVNYRYADLDNYESLLMAFKDCFGVFLYTLSPQDLGENRLLVQVRNAFMAARINRVNMFVWSTGILFRKGSGIPAIERVLGVEDELANSTMKYCVLRPSSLMDDILKPGNPSSFSLSRGNLTAFVDGGDKLGMISTEDIGRVAAKAFNEPSTFHGKKFDLIGDVKNGFEIAGILTRLASREMKFIPQPYPLALRIFLPAFITFLKFRNEEYFVEAQRDTQRALPEVQSLEQFLVKNKFTGPQESSSSCIIS